MFMRPTYMSDPLIGAEIEKLVKKIPKPKTKLPQGVLDLMKPKPAVEDANVAMIQNLAIGDGGIPDPRTINVEEQGSAPSGPPSLPKEGPVEEPLVDILEREVSVADEDPMDFDEEEDDDTEINFVI